ncbi:MAG: VWA domain-containing protein [Pyrinomonadaceae bacterium]|nr:VWA domain-containing protein [Pyrinomonadaceae bacterium]MBP6212021.1 VWA domain-containing protein [Pyrinomonadaceae bacterium]
MLWAVSPAQDVVREIKAGDAETLNVINYFGRVSIVAVPSETPQPGKLTASSPKGVTDAEVKMTSAAGRTNVEVATTVRDKRIDLTIYIAERARVKVETREGAVEISGNVAAVDVKTDTGTIATDVPDDDLTFAFHWTESRPRFVADFELPEVKERSAGRFEIRGRTGEERKRGKEDKKAETRPVGSVPDSEDPKPKIKDQKPQGVNLNFTTARGIILINVPPSEVGSDLRERPLTDAAKAIVRSGDSLLMEAIRRAAPKYYGDYARSLPPIKREPAFSVRSNPADGPAAQLKQALVRVSNLDNRAIAGLNLEDFEVTEGGKKREIVSVEQSTAPFNLVLLLDVSGSVENYVNFIRKAARNFVETVDKNDRVSLIIFNDDVKMLSKFTTDRGKLSTSLDTFDAGGGTAYYDALAYVVADTLRPLRGERTAVVILTDGDDNRSFLAFDSLLGSIQESGALIYPLYVPSGLIAAADGKFADIDPLRKKYMTLSAKSAGEGERLAKVSGGVYYPISQISQIQQAYEDIVVQLRTAYIITYRSDTADGASPRLKIKANRENAFTTVNSVKAVQ